MANTKHGLPQTKGFFKLRGNITGLHRENAFKKNTYDSGIEKRILSFGVETSPNSIIYVNVEGFKNDEVFLFKRSEKKGEKGESKKVPWSERYKYVDDGFNVIGVSIGLDQDENGENIIQTLIDYDAAKEIQNKLDDEMPVFVRGDIDYSSFKNNKDEVIRSTKFMVKNIYNSKSLDFESDDFEETCDFKQKIIFLGIEKNNEDGEDKFIVEAKVVTYNSIENVEFIITDRNLANQFRKGLKPYQAIDVWGRIFNRVDTEEVEESGSVWGEDDKFKKINKNYIRELIITGADPETIDKETYSEDAIEEAIRKLNSQGQVKRNNSDSDTVWGDSDDSDLDTDDLPW